MLLNNLMAHLAPHMVAHLMVAPLMVDPLDPVMARLLPMDKLKLLNQLLFDTK
jgi:hypothetical protein